MGTSQEEAIEWFRVREGMKQFLNMPIADWPTFKVQWDYKLESQRFAWDNDWDGLTGFLQDYPEGVKLFEVDLANLDSKLLRSSLQTKDEFWEVECTDKKAKIIFEWNEGKRLTPPLIVPCDDGLHLVVGGGNHRLAVARAHGERCVPILVLPKDVSMIRTILNVRDLTVER